MSPSNAQRAATDALGNLFHGAHVGGGPSLVAWASDRGHAASLLGSASTGSIDTEARAALQPHVAAVAGALARLVAAHWRAYEPLAEGDGDASALRVLAAVLRALARVVSVHEADAARALEPQRASLVRSLNRVLQPGTRAEAAVPRRVSPSPQRGPDLTRDTVSVSELRARVRAHALALLRALASAAPRQLYGDWALFLPSSFVLDVEAEPNAWPSAKAATAPPGAPAAPPLLRLLCHEPKPATRAAAARACAALIGNRHARAALLASATVSARLPTSDTPARKAKGMDVVTRVDAMVTATHEALIIALEANDAKQRSAAAVDNASECVRALYRTHARCVCFTFTARALL